MRRFFFLFGIAAVLCSVLLPLHAAQHRKRDEEPKPEILPLPPQLPMALAGDTRGETIIKLRAFVSGAGDARRVAAEAGQIFTEHKLPLPVVSIVQVGALGDESAAVVIEAVVATKRVLNPNGLAFFSGQSAPSFQEAIKRLADSARAASVSPDKLLSCTCFASVISDYA